MRMSGRCSPVGASLAFIGVLGAVANVFAASQRSKDNPLSGVEKTGRVRIALYGRSYKADWRVVGQTVEITSELGCASVTLGALASAPATVVQEKLREMARHADRPVRAQTDRARFNIRDA